MLFSAEDVLTATIRPRLEAAGAALEQVYILQTVEVRVQGSQKAHERGIWLPQDEAILAAAIRQVGAQLVMIDPLMAYLDVKLNSWRDQDVRAALAPLGRLAERTGAALLILRHLTKGGGGNALYRGGSIGIIGAARSGLLVAKSPDDPEQERILAASKSNLGPPMPSLRYRLQTLDGQRVRVEWLGASECTASTLLSHATEGGADTLVADAVAWLRELLADVEQLPAREIERAAQGAGFSGKPLYVASKRLHVRKQRIGFGQGALYYWSAPDAQAETEQRQRETQAASPSWIPTSSMDSLSPRKESMGIHGEHGARAALEQHAEARP